MSVRACYLDVFSHSPCGEHSRAEDSSCIIYDRQIQGVHLFVCLLYDWVHHASIQIPAHSVSLSSPFRSLCTSPVPLQRIGYCCSDNTSTDPTGSSTISVE